MKEMLIDAGWRFHLGDWGHAQAPGCDDSQWRVVDLPHDWSIELPRAADCPSGDQGGFFADGIGWYRKRVEIPKGWQDQRISVEFGGVYRDAEVWLNGHHLGLHPYGYTTFVLDLTPFLRRDGQADILAVRVDNSTHRHARWYSGSGIYRHVRLFASNPVHLAHWGVAVATADVSDGAATMSLRARVENDTADETDVSVRWDMLDPGGAAAGCATATARVKPGTATELETVITIPDAALWSPENPAIYRVETVLTMADEVVDSRSTPCGIRTIDFSASSGFLLNGNETLMRGGCVHHDCGPLGAASIDRAEERKVELLKQSGYNAIRCAHNPPSTAFLDACDRLGMLVIDEAFDVWRAPKLPYDYHRSFDDWWERDLDSMLLRDRNHPSIVLWSIGNELSERGLPEGADLARRLAEHVRRVDPTRPVTAGICDVWEEGGWRSTDGLLDALDVCGYNYRLEVYEDDHTRFPDRIMIATESFPPKALDYWRAVERLPYVVGDFVWTSLDYLGEAGIGHTYIAEEGAKALPGWPWNQANCGDIDLCGWKRPQSFYRDLFWGVAKGPVIMVHPRASEGKTVALSNWGWYDVQPSWTWPGQEGQELTIDVYAAFDEVELFLNDQSLGRQPAGPDAAYTATFSVPYAPGTIRAVGIADGKAASEAVLQTAGCPVSIGLDSDREVLDADRNDLAYITVSARDADDRLVPTAEQAVFVTVTGPARIAAVANADPRNLEPYRGNRARFWRGRCLVVVQPTGAAGTVVVQAQADGLCGATISLDVQTVP